MTLPAVPTPPEESFSIEEMVDRFESAGQPRGKDKFWFARDLAVLLGYKRWETFLDVIAKAKRSAQESGYNVADHFRGVPKMVPLGSGAQRAIDDIQLSRYAAYLIAQNADPRKRPVAVAQTYFAIQTRRQELADQNGIDFSSLTGDQQRLYLRNQVVEENKKLSGTAKGAGVITGPDHAAFQTKGYQGLYGGMNVPEIRRHKGLPASAKILDHMGSTELAANLFRITQTEEKLRAKGIMDKYAANDAHYEVGRKVRETMRQLSGIYPENLPVEADVKKLAKTARRIQRQAKIAPPDQEPAPESRATVAIDLRADMWKYALLIMSVQPDGYIKTTTLIDELPKFIHVSEEQAIPNSSRKDSKFSQIVRNLKSHKTSSTNFIYNGFAEDMPGGFRITPKGLEYVWTYFQDGK